MKKASYVFVVDDDLSARRGIARLLRTAGHDVRDYASANEFLDAFSSEECECLVLDARMPGLSGEELQAELKARGLDLKIIIVTADDDLETKRKAQEMNVAGFFRKPLTAQRFSTPSTGRCGRAARVEILRKIGGEIMTNSHQGRQLHKMKQTSLGLYVTAKEA